MNITKQQLKQLIKEELEVTLSDVEAKEVFGDDAFDKDTLAEGWEEDRPIGGADAQREHLRRAILKTRILVEDVRHELRVKFGELKRGQAEIIKLVQGGR